MATPTPIPMLMKYTVDYKSGGSETIEADALGIVEGWFLFIKQSFTREFGVVSHTLRCIRTSDVEEVRGVFQIQPSEKPNSGLEIVTN